MVPKGYHPVTAPHGYDLYYLNVMARPNRFWAFKDERLMVEYHKSSPTLAHPSHWDGVAPTGKCRYPVIALPAEHV